MSATTSHPLQQQELDDYANVWQTILKEKDNQKLRHCFTSDSESLSNYTYLPLAYAKQIVASAPVSIQSVLVAAPSDGQTVFSTVFFGIDQHNQPTSELYLAGVAPQPAEIIRTAITALDGVPLAYAADIIDNWKGQNLDTLSTELFTTAEGPLRLFTHKLEDFQKAIADAESNGPGYNALWFNFALHDSTDPKWPVPFATVLCLNDLPEVDKRGIMVLNAYLHYYDLSKPCPPACYNTYNPPAAVTK